MNSTVRFLKPLFWVFIINLIAIAALWKILIQYGVNTYVLLGANLLFFLISALVFVMQKKALNNKNPNVFIRSVMGGMMIKMIVCIIAVFLYVFLAGKGYNKKAVFISMFIYLIYLAAEVKSLMKLNKHQHA